MPVIVLTAACVVYAVALTLLGARPLRRLPFGRRPRRVRANDLHSVRGFGDTAEGGSHFLHHFSPLSICARRRRCWPLAGVTGRDRAVAGALVAPPMFLLRAQRAVAHRAACGGRDAALPAAGRRYVHRFPRERFRAGGDRVADLGRRRAELVRAAILVAGPLGSKRMKPWCSSDRCGICDGGVAPRRRPSSALAPPRPSVSFRFRVLRPRAAGGGRPRPWFASSTSPPTAR